MPTPPGFRLFLLALSLGSAGSAAAPISHRFLAIDEGRGNLLCVNEADPAHDWHVSVGHLRPRDLQLIGGGRVLLGHANGFAEYDLATGRREFDLGTYANVSSARRLPNGHTLVVYAVEKPPTGVFVVELNPAHQRERIIVYPGNYVRLMRQTAKSTFLFGMNEQIKEGDGRGNYLWTATVPGFHHAWKALRLPNGHTLASAGSGAFMVDLGPDGTIARKFGAAGDVPAAVHPFFYGGFQLLTNGDVVVANWQGHGPNHGQTGVQLLEFDPTGAIVWQWSDRKLVSSLQGVLILDGLNPDLLYDERDGVMTPL